MSKNDADEAVSVVSLTSSSGGYINGRNSANLELLIDKTSSIYLYVKLKALASWIFLSFTSFWRNSDSYEYKNKSARRGTQFVPIGMPTTCWNSVPPKETYVIDEELQHTDHLFLGIACFTFLNFVWKICGIGPTQQLLSHSFYDWKLCELFLLSGLLICHAVGWYIELKNQKFWWRIHERKILI